MSHEPSASKNPLKSFETGARPRTLRSDFVNWFFGICGLAVVVLLTGKAYRERDAFLKAHPQPSLPTNRPDQLTTHLSPIAVMYSVVWEGQEIRPSNIAAIQRIRANHPQLQMYHFLSPGYFTRRNADLSSMKQELNKVIRQDDLVGLHFNGWKSVVERSGVEFKFKENFWGGLLDEASCGTDCGNDIPLDGYSFAEVSRVMRTSLNVLEEIGFSNINGFMVNGWQANETINAAAVQNGIRFGFSRVWPELVEQPLRGYPIYSNLRRLWPDVSVDNFAVTTRVSTKFGDLTELGNSATAVDFLDVDHLTALTNRLIESKRQQPAVPMLIHLSIHQETAARFESRFSQAVAKIQEELNTSNLLFEVSPRASMYGLRHAANLSH